jgi:hypothetical protein
MSSSKTDAIKRKYDFTDYQVEDSEYNSVLFYFDLRLNKN